MTTVFSCIDVISPDSAAGNRRGNDTARGVVGLTKPEERRKHYGGRRHDKQRGRYFVAREAGRG